jgi:hypothetical protein
MRRGHKLATALRDAGFSQVRLETLKLKPAVVCALGVNASGGDVRRSTPAPPPSSPLIVDDQPP